jgi:hypothetical protein
MYMVQCLEPRLTAELLQGLFLRLYEYVEIMRQYRLLSIQVVAVFRVSRIRHGSGHSCTCAA